MVFGRLQQWEPSRVHWNLFPSIQLEKQKQVKIQEQALNNFAILQHVIFIFIFRLIRRWRIAWTLAEQFPKDGGISDAAKRPHLSTLAEGFPKDGGIYEAAKRPHLRRRSDGLRWRKRPSLCRRVWWRRRSPSRPRYLLLTFALHQIFTPFFFFYLIYVLMGAYGYCISFDFVILLLLWVKFFVRFRVSIGVTPEN